MVKEYDQETVDAFLGADFDISDISRLSDAYYGCFDSEEEFAENFVTECYGIPDIFQVGSLSTGRNMGRWTLSWDYTFYDGYVFCNHY